MDNKIVMTATSFATNMASDSVHVVKPPFPGNGETGRQTAANLFSNVPNVFSNNYVNWDIPRWYYTYAALESMRIRNQMTYGRYNYINDTATDFMSFYRQNHLTPPTIIKSTSATVAHPPNENNQSKLLSDDRDEDSNERNAFSHKSKHNYKNDEGMILQTQTFNKRKSRKPANTSTGHFPRSGPTKKQNATTKLEAATYSTEPGFLPQYLAPKMEHNQFHDVTKDYSLNSAAAPFAMKSSSRYQFQGNNLDFAKLREFNASNINLNAYAYAPSSSAGIRNNSISNQRNDISVSNEKLNICPICRKICEIEVMEEHLYQETERFRLNYFSEAAADIDHMNQIFETQSSTSKNIDMRLHPFTGNVNRDLTTPMTNHFQQTYRKIRNNRASRMKKNFLISKNYDQITVRSPQISHKPDAPLVLKIQEANNNKATRIPVAKKFKNNIEESEISLLNRYTENFAPNMTFEKINSGIFNLNNPLHYFSQLENNYNYPQLTNFNVGPMLPNSSTYFPFFNPNYPNGASSVPYQLSQSLSWLPTATDNYITNPRQLNSVRTPLARTPSTVGSSEKTTDHTISTILKSPAALSVKSQLSSFSPNNLSSGAKNNKCQNTIVPYVANNGLTTNAEDVISKDDLTHKQDPHFRLRLNSGNATNRYSCFDNSVIFNVSPGCNQIMPTPVNPNIFEFEDDDPLKTLSIPDHEASPSTENFTKNSLKNYPTEKATNGNCENFEEISQTFVQRRIEE